jgi:hypothetical protein
MEMEPGVYFGHIDLCNIGDESFDTELFDCAFRVDFEKQKVIRLDTGEERDIKEWNTFGVSFDHFKM